MPVTALETDENLPIRNSKVLRFEELAGLRKQHTAGKIVHCHGVFDVLHAGHLTYFESAKRFGDILVVTITTDKCVNKGPGRPYFPENVRANMVAALQIVDYVAVSPFPTAVPSIENLKPHFYVKGPDYQDKTKDVSGAIYAEETAAKKHGGQLVFTEDETFSSSTILNRFFMPWTKDQLSTIEKVKAAGGAPAIDRVVEEMGKLKVCILGEPIIDSYVFCMPESISSKSHSI